MRKLVVAAAVVLAALPSAATAKNTSLYTGPGSKPGPALLYKKPAKSPQLTNSGIWKAKPILVSGASAYRKGEFLYQDWLFDDRGAHLTTDPADPKEAGN